jgi:hypothetical protein
MYIVHCSIPLSLPYSNDSHLVTPNLIPPTPDPPLFQFRSYLIPLLSHIVSFIIMIIQYCLYTRDVRKLARRRNPAIELNINARDRDTASAVFVHK